MYYTFTFVTSTNNGLRIDGFASFICKIPDLHLEIMQSQIWYQHFHHFKGHICTLITIKKYLAFKESRYCWKNTSTSLLNGHWDAIITAHHLQNDAILFLLGKLRQNRIHSFFLCRSFSLFFLSFRHSVFSNKVQFFHTKLVVVKVSHFLITVTIQHYFNCP